MTVSGNTECWEINVESSEWNPQYYVRKTERNLDENYANLNLYEGNATKNLVA